jgi:hypothetical protein
LVLVEGVAAVEGAAVDNGGFELLSANRAFGVYPGSAKIPAEIAGFTSTPKDRCWFRLFGVRVRGRPFANHLLMATTVEITRRYSDAEVPTLLESIHFEALRGKHTCGSY